MKYPYSNKKPTYEQHDNENINYYQQSVNDLKLKYHDLDNSKIDICIIGGGLTGVSSALYLSKKGYNVTLLEARKIGWGASGRNGGQLGGGLRKEQKILEKKLGFNHALELWKLGQEAVQEVKNNIKNYSIDCDLVNGVLTAGYFKDDDKYFQDEINHMAKKYNYNKYDYINKSNIGKEINTNIYYSGILNKGSYHLHPLKYLYGLTKEIIKKGVKIYENTPVKKIDIIDNKVFINTERNRFEVEYVVIACNGYLDNLLGNIRNKFMPINNYIIATEPLGKEKAKKIIKNNYAVCDTRFIIDYYRFSKDFRMIFGGGETFTNKYLKNPKSYVLKRMYRVFPELESCKVDFCWGGTLAITVNRFPDFGRFNNNKIIYSQGYSGHGLALTTLAGKLISEYISGNQDRFEFFEKIPHIKIPGGDFLRRPIYSAGVAYYKFLDFIH